MPERLRGEIVCNNRGSEHRFQKSKPVRCHGEKIKKKKKKRKIKDHTDEEGDRNPHWLPMTRMLSTKASAQPCAALSPRFAAGC